MKTTTYIIGGIVAAGALITGLVSYVLSASTFNTVPSYEFSDSVATRELAQADSVAISFQSALPEGTKVFFNDGIELRVTESAEAQSPRLEVSPEWLPLLNLQETEQGGRRVLDIIVDAHGLKEYYGLTDTAKVLRLYLDAPEINLVMPAGSMQGVSADRECRIEATALSQSKLNAKICSALSLTECDIEVLNVEIPVLEEYEYTILKLKNSEIGAADISVISPGLTISGPCNIDDLAIHATSTDRDNQFVTLKKGVTFRMLNWDSDNASKIDFEIRSMPSCRIDVDSAEE